jgi:hypothetical protein
MSNDGDFNKKNLNIFKMLMLYLNPIGPVGLNIDMFKDDIENFDRSLVNTSGKLITPPRMFTDFLKKLVFENGFDLYQNTNKQDYVYVCDMTIDPLEKKITLKPKFWNYSRETEKKKFKDGDFEFKEVILNNIPKLRDGRDYWFFIEFAGEGSRFSVTDTKLHTDDYKGHVPFNTDNADNEVFLYLRDYFGPDEDTDFDGNIVFGHDGVTMVTLNYTKKEFISGDSIIITSKDFND